MLANEAVKPERQMEIVDLGGLRLLLPLTQSPDLDIQRLAAHALANLSVHADNQVRGARIAPVIVCMFPLLRSPRWPWRRGVA